MLKLFWEKTMANKMQLGLKQTQSLMMTPQLQQAIKLLTLTHLEMTNVIAEEMVENPMLEERDGEVSKKEIENQTSSEMQNQEATADNFSGPDIIDGGKEEFDWDRYIEVYNSTSSTPPSMVGPVSSEEMPNYENLVSKGSTLAEHLEFQLRMDNLTDQEWELAYNVIHNIDDDGYLEVEFDEIISKCRLEREDAFEILKMIQNSDPVGCGSRNLIECLMVQAKNLEPRMPLVELLIEKHLDLLHKKDYKTLEKITGVISEKIKDAELIILSFNPRPGRLISAEEVHYVVPDIYVKDIGGELIVTLNNDGVPRLKISGLYRSMLQSDSGESDKAQEFVQDKLRSALWLIKSIENRQRTIEKVAKAIVKYQPDFFRKGPSALKPMILKDIAAEIGMHESTVSRVTTNKYMHTAIGIFELKYFFNAGIGGKNGGIDIAGESLKLKIKELIENEVPGRPLSDQRISKLLEIQDIVVARRTVAKYREMMNILPSARRKVVGR